MRLKAIRDESMMRIRRREMAGRREMILGWIRRIEPWMMAPRRSHVEMEKVTWRMLNNC